MLIYSYFVTSFFFIIIPLFLPIVASLPRYLYFQIIGAFTLWWSLIAFVGFKLYNATSIRQTFQLYSDHLTQVFNQTDKGIKMVGQLVLLKCFFFPLMFSIIGL